jgi:hypothetical protein
MIYSDSKIAKDIVIRTFDESIDPIELKWHRDDEDRMVVAIAETDWMIQLENKLPQNLNSAVFIEKGEWHRLIKGRSKLKVKIVKNYE